MMNGALPLRLWKGCGSSVPSYEKGLLRGFRLVGSLVGVGVHPLLLPNHRRLETRGLETWSKQACEPWPMVGHRVA